MAETGVASGTGSTLDGKSPPGPSVVAEGLRKSYGPVLAVDDLSFQVAKGELLGLLGPNGAGKSTALRMLIGFQYPDSGRVRLNGFDVFQDGPRARASLGYLPESVPLYAEMEVRTYLLFFAGVKGIPRPAAEVARVIDQIDLGRVIGRPCGNLSRGYRQRVALAQALLSDPSVLILDEPTSGLDPNQIHDFRSMVRGLSRDRAVLLSTHILPEALEVCDRIIILNRGRMVAAGSPGEIMGEGPSVHWARLRLPNPPSAAEAERFDLFREDESAPTGGSAGLVYRVRRDLPREEARALLRLVLDRDGEVLEWGTGAAGLEAIFRKLTLGEEEA